MAEVLGTVAGGLQVAALTTKISTIVFKVRALYGEIQGASVEVAASLDEINTLLRWPRYSRNWADH